MSKEQFKAEYRPEYSRASGLPFAGPFDWPKKLREFDGDRYAVWALPDTGSYTDGCDAGSAAAAVFLKELRENGASPGGQLQCIVLDMVRRGALSPQSHGLRGQIVAFFAELERWLAAAAKQYGASLDSKSKEELCRLLQDASDGGPERRWQEELARDRSERARRAAKTRWGRRRKTNAKAKRASR